ncbi:hypothetical protein EDD85DRAFT_250319 [Armillaria nabsnona]|nr:hypothetical protein EDD85DRAFT_250319 [Armillaria nabsnona]
MAHIREPLVKLSRAREGQKLELRGSAGQGLSMRFREVEVTEVRADMFNGRRPKCGIWTSESAMLVPNSIPPENGVNPGESNIPTEILQSYRKTHAILSHLPTVLGAPRRSPLCREHTQSFWEDCFLLRGLRSGRQFSKSAAGQGQLVGRRVFMSVASPWLHELRVATL